MPGGFPLEISQNYQEVAAKFPEQLPAGAARRSRFVGGRNDRDMGELAVPF